MHENEIEKIIVDTGLKIHKSLGPGLLESVYEVILTHELIKRGNKAERQKPVPLHYDNINFDEGFRVDIMVDDLVIVELKSVVKDIARA